MVGDDERDAVVPVHGASQLPDRELRIEQRLRGERAERDDDLGPNDLQLTHEIRAAGSDFRRRGVPIRRWPMLEHVADEHVFSRQLDGAKNLCQQLTSSTDKGAALLVFVLAGRLANADEIGSRISLARYRVLRALM